jgi:hypothetical protein
MDLVHSFRAYIAVSMRVAQRAANPPPTPTRAPPPQPHPRAAATAALQALPRIACEFARACAQSVCVRACVRVRVGDSKTKAIRQSQRRALGPGMRPISHVHWGGLSELCELQCGQAPPISKCTSWRCGCRRSRGPGGGLHFFKRPSPPFVCLRRMAWEVGGAHKGIPAASVGFAKTPSRALRRQAPASTADKLVNQLAMPVGDLVSNSHFLKRDCN